MNDTQSQNLIPEESPADLVQCPQPDFPKWAESDINLTVVSAALPLQATDTPEQLGTSKNGKGANRGLNPLSKVTVSNRAEESLRSTLVVKRVQLPKITLTQRPKTDKTQSQQQQHSGLKMHPASTAIPKALTALTTAKTETKQRHEMKGRNDDDGRSQEIPLPRTLKSLKHNRLEQDSKTTSKSTTVTGRTQQSEPTRIKTNHRIHPNTKGLSPRKAGGTGSSHATGFKESKASSKSSTSQKTSPGFNAEPCRFKTATENPRTDLKVGNNSFTSRRGLVLSKSALADLISPLTLSPRLNSARSSPGSAAKSPDSLGPNKEVLRSSASVPGNYLS